MSNGIPEKRLVWAVLERAILDCIGALEKAYMQEMQERLKISEAWLWVNSPLLEPWTFEWCCEVLDICPVRVRKVIFDFKGEKVKHAASSRRNLPVINNDPWLTGWNISPNLD